MGNSRYEWAEFELLVIARTRSTAPPLPPALAMDPATPLVMLVAHPAASRRQNERAKRDVNDLT
jgi:hypothetical protein